jgi:hypothetical protein
VKNEDIAPTIHEKRDRTTMSGIIYLGLEGLRPIII